MSDSALDDASSAVIEIIKSSVRQAGALPWLREQVRLWDWREATLLAQDENYRLMLDDRNPSDAQDSTAILGAIVDSFGPPYELGEIGDRKDREFRRIYNKFLLEKEELTSTLLESCDDRDTELFFSRLSEIRDSFQEQVNDASKRCGHVYERDVQKYQGEAWRALRYRRGAIGLERISIQFYLTHDWYSRGLLELRNWVTTSGGVLVQDSSIEDIDDYDSKPLSINDLELLEAMLSLGATSDTPATLTEIIAQTKRVLEGKHSLDTLKKFGYVRSVPNKGSYLTRLGINRINRHNRGDHLKY